MARIGPYDSRNRFKRAAIQTLQRSTQFDIAIEPLVSGLRDPETDWQAVGGAWFEVLLFLQAASDEYEQPLRNAGVALVAGDAEQFRGWLELIGDRWRGEALE